MSLHVAAFYRYFSSSFIWSLLPWLLVWSQPSRVQHSRINKIWAPSACFWCFLGEKFILTTSFAIVYPNHVFLFGGKKFQHLTQKCWDNGKCKQRQTYDCNSLKLRISFKYQKKTIKCWNEEISLCLKRYIHSRFDTRNILQRSWSGDFFPFFTLHSTDNTVNVWELRRPVAVIMTLESFPTLVWSKHFWRVTILDCRQTS